MTDETEIMAGEPSIIPTRKAYTYWTDERADKAVAFARQNGSHMGLIAQAAGVSREVLRDRLKNDPSFKDRFDDALEERNLELETEARRRAVAGVTRRKYDKDGNLLEEEQVYSDRLMEKLLEADMPERFRDKSNPFHQGSVGGVLLIPLVPMEKALSAEDLSKRLEELSVVQDRLEREGSSG